MNSEHCIAGSFRMDEEAWARHANPWSGWTRLPALSLLAAAGWSRAWLDARALLPVGAVPAWITRAALGERLRMARDAAPVPAHHRRVPNVLSALVATGAALALWGVLVLDPMTTVAGLLLNLLAKLWFLDRIMWLHRDMRA